MTDKNNAYPKVQETLQAEQTFTGILDYGMSFITQEHVFDSKNDTASTLGFS